MEVLLVLPLNRGHWRADQSNSHEGFMRRDLVQHFIGGALIAAMVALAFSRDLDVLTSALVGLTVAVLVGVLKEAVWDNWLKKGTDDKYDVIATALGGAFGALVLWGFLNYT